jgi:uncharacterized protein
VAGASLFALIDDIASVLDDVAALSKVAIKKTSGVLGDDLAVNAEQVHGVHADREIPVVLAVAKGSLVNKAILVPSALALSFFLPSLITPLLFLGGCFLCFEGVEKLLSLFEGHVVAVVEPEPLNASEAEKIKGAIRTDFVLSAEIIVITLGTLINATFWQSVIVLVAVASVMTVGVYGFVAMIIKLDDFGLYLMKGTSTFGKRIGKTFLTLAPKLMRFLSIAGTVAMFLVGGGIVAHAVPMMHDLVLPPWSLLFETLLGLILGFIVLGCVKLVSLVKKSP